MEKNNQIDKILKYYNPIVHPTVIFRKKEICSLGKYNEKFLVSQDYELWVKASNFYKIAILNKYLYSLRMHQDSISKNRNYEQRVNTFYINIFKNFPKINIDKFLKIDPLEFTKSLEESDKELYSFSNSRLYVLFYDRVSLFKIFTYNFKTVAKIIDYYLNRPKYLYYRLRYF